jgi:hypothetical protein
MIRGETMTSAQNIPWKTLSDDLGEIPFYIVEFDKDGRCTSPEARDHLVEASKSHSDVFLFSHGWNNDWDAATGRYDQFVERFTEVRHARWNPPARDFRPVLVGVFWPSGALVAPDEAAPDIAGGGAEPQVAQVAAELEPDARTRFLEIVAAPADSDPKELAKLLVPVLAGGDEEVGEQRNPPTEGELLEVWQAVATKTSQKQQPAGGFIDDDPVAAEIAAPVEAGRNPLTWVRDAVRATTVWLMKDRAGRVGGRGVADLLRMLADASGDSRIALAGHSYGSKVVLSALCNGPAPSRSVDSVLLLEPALSCYAFTDNLDGHPGGYRNAFDRSRLPIIATYSSHDVPLTRFFHLAVRRKSDLAEAVIAGQPPSKFAALGGYGPQGVEAEWIDMLAVGDPYPLTTPRRIIGLNGSKYIASHGAVETPETAWALLSQVQA